MTIRICICPTFFETEQKGLADHEKERRRCQDSLASILLVRASISTPSDRIFPALWFDLVSCSFNADDTQFRAQLSAERTNRACWLIFPNSYYPTPWDLQIRLPTRSRDSLLGVSTFFYTMYAMPETIPRDHDSMNADQSCFNRPLALRILRAANLPSLIRTPAVIEYLQRAERKRLAGT